MSVLELLPLLNGSPCGNGSGVSDVNENVAGWEEGTRGDDGVVLVKDVFVHGGLKDEG